MDDIILTCLILFDKNIRFDISKYVILKNIQIRKLILNSPKKQTL